MERRRNERGQIDTTPPLTRRFGVLGAAIGNPSSPIGATPPLTTVWLLDFDPSDTNPNPKLRFTNTSVQVANYDPSLSGGTPATVYAGVVTNVPTFVIIELIGGVWVFVWTGC